MEKEAAIQLYSSSDNWLARGRRDLILTLIEKYLSRTQGRLLEVGAGGGNFAETMSIFGTLDVIESHPDAQPFLAAKGKLIDTIYTDPVPKTPLSKQYHLVGMFDVIEHLEDDKGALKWLARFMLEDSIAIITVPAYQFLWSDHDVANHHFRRYTLTTLKEVLPEEFEYVHGGYFNTILFPIAFASRIVLKIRSRFRLHTDCTKQSSNVPKIVDRLFGSVLRFECFLAKAGVSLPFGLTVFCVIRRKTE